MCARACIYRYGSLRATGMSACSRSPRRFQAHNNVLFILFHKSCDIRARAVLHIYIRTPRFDSAREIYARSSNLCSPAALNICCIALFCILYARRCVCVHLYIRGKSAVSTAPRGNGYIHLYKRQSATIRIANNFFF